MYVDIINDTASRAGMTPEELIKFFERRDPEYAAKLRALYQAEEQEKIPELNQDDDRNTE